MGLFRRSRQDAGGASALTVLFVTDLHGSEYTFRKLLRALEMWEPHVLMMGGDAGGKGLFPVLRLDDSRYVVEWMGERREVNEANLAGTEDRALRLGFYPFRADAEQITAMRDDPAYAERVFEQHMVARWGNWLDRLEERCAQLRIPAFVIAGNDDPWTMDGPLQTEREWVKWADGKVLPVGDVYQVLSTGLANTTPWQCPRDVSEEELSRHLNELAAQVEDFANVICNIHVPPFDSGLDLATRLDTSTYPPRPIAGEQVPVGSTAVASFLRERQPLVAFVGHIHECPGATKIGRTHVVNPGSEYAEEVLRGVLVTVDRGRVRGHQFVSG